MAVETVPSLEPTKAMWKWADEYENALCPADSTMSPDERADRVRTLAEGLSDFIAAHQEKSHG